jgi:hypothetical protein
METAKGRGPTKAGQAKVLSDRVLRDATGEHRVRVIRDATGRHSIEMSETRDGWLVTTPLAIHHDERSGHGPRVVAAGVRIEPVDARAPVAGLTMRALRRLGFDAHVKFARMLRVPHQREDVMSWVGGTPLEALLATSPKPTGPRRGRPPTPEALLARVAAAYAKAIRSKRTRKSALIETAKALGMEKRIGYVRGLLHKARYRERPLLDQGKQGTAGGGLTPYGRAAVRRLKRTVAAAERAVAAARSRPRAKRRSSRRRGARR